jgi:hypothetical protein
VISLGESGILRAMPTPEDQARKHIDQALEKAGWRVQDYKSTHLQVGRGAAFPSSRNSKPPSKPTSPAPTACGRRLFNDLSPAT